MEIFKTKTEIPFLNYRRIALVGSGGLLVVCLASIIFRGLNFGIDFSGGTLVEVGYSEPVAVESVRDALDERNIENAVVQHFGTAQDVLVRLPAGAESADSARTSERVIAALRAPYDEELTDATDQTIQQCAAAGGVRACRVQMRRVEFVGPQVGDELTNQGSLAMLYALLCILVYVTFRFEWRFALGSVIALAHDVLITVGIFSLFQFDFSLPVLAAVLAVIGYSLNDTIVVYDRIRENFRKLRRDDTTVVMNQSINQTLPRTVLTSITTLFVVLILLLFGGEVTRGFATALLVGVLIGTYSSIFVASPVVLMLGINREHLLEVKKEGGGAA